MKMSRTAEILFTIAILAGTCGIVIGGDFCTSSTDCGSGQCCLGTAVWAELDQVVGTCQPRGATSYSCYVQNDLILQENEKAILNDKCACQERHDCRGTGKIIPIRGEEGVCEQWCSLSSECAPSECCAMVMDHNETRQKRESDVGMCRQLTKLGNFCYLVDSRHDEYNFVCPCAQGLYCQGDGEFQLMIGETGTCTLKDIVENDVHGK